ncbi:hypothetical protein Micbo1qcDRAFT_159250, partial [Microdochium bolleyi]
MLLNLACTICLLVHRLETPVQHVLIVDLPPAPLSVRKVNMLAMSLEICFVTPRRAKHGVRVVDIADALSAKHKHPPVLIHVYVFIGHAYAVVACCTLVRAGNVRIKYLTAALLRAPYNGLVNSRLVRAEDLAYRAHLKALWIN